MSSVKGLQTKAINAMQSLGKAALAAMYPNDFEFYMCALELATSNGDTIDYFTFPVTPSSINKVENKRTSIYNTAGGIVALTSPVFVPQTINIKGSFGRIFKILIQSASIGTGVAFSLSNGIRTLRQLKKKVASLKTPSFDAGVKTGYGAFKILQSIVAKSNGTDEEGKPFRLYFYNPALGESYLVMIPPEGFSCSQNEQRNMVWDYSLNMVILAPLEDVKNTPKSTSLKKSMSVNAIQKTVNDLASYLVPRI